MPLSPENWKTDSAIHDLLLKLQDEASATPAVAKLRTESDNACQAFLLAQEQYGLALSSRLCELYGENGLETKGLEEAIERHREALARRERYITHGCIGEY